MGSDGIKVQHTRQGCARCVQRDTAAFAREDAPAPALPGRHNAGDRDQSCRTMLRRELLILRPPLYSMSPSFLNLFMKKFTLARVVPIISASVSWEIFGSLRCGLAPP